MPLALAHGLDRHPEYRARVAALLRRIRSEEEGFVAETIRGVWERNEGKQCLGVLYCGRSSSFLRVLALAWTLRGVWEKDVGKECMGVCVCVCAPWAVSPFVALSFFALTIRGV